MSVWSVIRVPGWWQLRLWLPRHTLRVSCERKSALPGPVDGGWPSA